MTLPSSKIYLFQIKISVYVNFRFNLTGSVLFTLQHYNQSEDFDIHCSELYFKLQPAGFDMKDPLTRLHTRIALRVGFLLALCYHYDY